MMTRLTLLLLALLALPRAAWPAPAGYALASLTATADSHPVAEVEDGVIFSRYLDAACEPLITDEADGEPSVLVGTRATEIALSASILGCRRSAEPAVHCSWEIRPEADPDPSCRKNGGGASSTGDASWHGWEGVLSLALPELTGPYELDLVCRIEGEGTESEERVTRSLYVTWGEPLAAFSPPPAEWYARAACWAAGLGDGDTEADVLSSVREGLYRWGGAHWRYGYADRIEPGRYRFPLFENESGTRSLEYVLEDEESDADDAGDSAPTCGSDGSCTCSWQALVSSKAACNFADCYVFSEVLEGIAAVAGVGGLRYVAITGEAGRGFLTRPARSLDPAFPDTMSCDGPECDGRYYFGSHSLRLRDGAYFDATFNRSYSTPGEPIAVSETTIRAGKENRDTRSFPDSSTTLIKDRDGYGGWHYFRYSDPVAAPPAASADSGGPPIRFTGNVKFDTRSWDEDEHVNQLVAVAEIEVLVSGEHTLLGGLFHEDEPVATRTFWRAVKPPGTTVSGGPGEYRVRFRFSGEEIYKSGKDGPWELRVRLADSDTELRTETPEFDHEDFGELSGRILGVDAWRHDPGEGGRSSLRVGVAIEARENGLLAVQARLSKGANTVAYDGHKEELFTGKHTLDLELPIVEDSKGPHTLTVVLYDSQLRSIDDFEETYESWPVAARNP